MIKLSKIIIFSIFISLYSNVLLADFFKDISNLIDNNKNRLSYGVSVSDVNKDNKY